MSQQEDSWDRLDTEFDRFLLDMKPYVLKHPIRTGESSFNLRSLICRLCSCFSYTVLSKLMTL